MKTKDRIETRSNKGIISNSISNNYNSITNISSSNNKCIKWRQWNFKKEQKMPKNKQMKKNQEEMEKLDDYKGTIDQYADGTGGGSGGGTGTNFTNIDTAKSNPAGVVPAGSTVIEPDASKGIVIKDKKQ